MEITVRIIGIESSAMTASVSILTDDVVTAEYSTNFKQTHSQTLLPMLDEICKRTQTPIESVDCIAISSGPGSFTGLRIGASTGKGIALSLDKPVAAIPTLEALAYNMAGCKALVCPIMDARRNTVYNALYKIEQEKIECIQEVSLTSIEDVIEALNQRNEEIIFVGDACAMHRELFKEKLSVKYTIAPANNCQPRAATVAALGKMYYENGNVIDADLHAPDYLRPSQAERERNNEKND